MPQIFFWTPCRVFHLMGKLKKSWACDVLCFRFWTVLVGFRHRDFIAGLLVRVAAWCLASDRASQGSRGSFPRYTMVSDMQKYFSAWFHTGRTHFWAVWLFCPFAWEQSFKLLAGGGETISRTVSARMTCTNGDGYFPILNHGFNSWHRDVFGACDGLIASAGGQPGETQDQNVHKCQWERRMVAKVEPTRLKSSIHENFLPIGPIVKEPASGFLFLLIPFQPGPGSYPAIENREKNNKKTNAQCQWTWNACRKLSRNRFWSRTCHLPCPTLSAPLSPHGCSLTPQGVQLLKLSRHSIRAPLDWAHPENMVATAGVAAAQRKFNCWSCFFLVGSDSAQRSPS